jgi:alpha-tubulin suppressor-like RCC1 family protein
MTDTLLYSWGNAKHGKLGISNNYFSELTDGDSHTQFFCDDDVPNNDTLPELDDTATLEEIEARQNLIEFNFKHVFTAVP